MTEPSMHPLTRRDFENYVQHPSHAIAIFGEEGIGKSYIALHLAAKLLDFEPTKLERHPYFRIFSPDEKGVIKIEQAHDIVSWMKLKTTGTQTIRRVVVVEHAHRLTNDAQNALLKLIEEPPTDTVILLTATTDQLLLSTIRSRVQSLQVRIPAKEDLFEAFTATGNFSTQQLERAYLLSGGLPGLCHALALGSSDHPLVRMIATAKELLAADTFTRMTHVDEYADRSDAELLVQAMGHIARSGLSTSVTKVNKSAMARWHSILQNIAQAQIGLASNGSPKLVLATLFLHI